MWFHFSFLFLFVFTGIFLVSNKYHHINEVFNAISHDYLYEAILIDLNSLEVYFGKGIVRDLVGTHFAENLKRIDYDYTITFYADGKECNEDVLSRFFTIKLEAELGFSAYYDKTFIYYFT